MSEEEVKGAKRPREEELVLVSPVEAKTMKAARFEGREMPAAFHTMLGEPYEIPEEAKDIEDSIQGHADFADLPPARQEAVKVAVRRFTEKVTKAGNDAKPSDLDALVRRAGHLPGLPDGLAKKSELTAAYRLLVRAGEIEPCPAAEALLVRKKGKSHSGVLVITVFMGPGKFSCPKDCHYCPNQPGVARSYLLKEPGVLRGFRNGWDPIRQFYDRASALENNGHVVDKIELIILGGTFSFYPKDYVEEFMTASFYAANTYFDMAPLRPSKSLQEEITMNETARCRIIGVTAETRPDFISVAELRRFRSLGITRVQLGIQHLDDDILEYINRECPTAKTVVAIKRLLDAGFKVDAHWMPDLPGSSYAKDLEMFQLLFSPENTAFQVDQWKVYPTAVVPYTKIMEWYDQGLYKPYAQEQGGKLMVDLMLFILKNCPYRIRLNRIIRDIPTTYIKAGEMRCNLRQLLEQEMKQQGVRCRDVRERECKGAPIDRSSCQVFVDEFRASEGTEFYISVENADRSQLYGHLRLRLRDDSSGGLFPALKNAALIRELHTYGRLIRVSAANTGKETQHVGVGTQLMKKAEEIAGAKGFTRVAVIAGVGVRKYYEKLGYRLEDTYMVKESLTEASVISEKQELEDDDNDNQVDKGFFATVRQLLGW
jgi:elongator complex protein 3